MKSTLKIILFSLLALVLFLAAFLTAQSVRLKWWLSPQSAALDELTPEQKADDMRYLLDLTRQVSPAEAVWNAAGLDNPLNQPAVWIERARSTPSNSEFAGLVLQFLVHVGQGGHAFLAYDAGFNPTTSLVSNAPRDAFSKMPQWAALLSQLPWNAHADLDMLYQAGQYILSQDASIEGVIIPADSQVESVDGVNADEYALQQQYRTHLRYDPAQKKFFIFPLLTIDPGSSRPGWQVAFRLPDRSLKTVLVRKIPGYVPHRPDESQSANTDCVALNKAVLYVRMRTFYRMYVAEDAETLQRCFASGSYQKVIFDVRGNNGGEIWSYMDNVIAPLIRAPISFESTSAVKDTFYAWYGWRFWLFQLTNNNELADPIAHVARIDPISYPPYSDQGWRVVRVTRRIEPASKPFSFDGEVYVLADNNTLSAADSFAAVMQRSGLAKVAGANTVGWGQTYQSKMLYALPHSGILFYMDAELTLNPDGTLDNFTGVLPDVFLNPSSYPTPYPGAYDRETLLADSWVQWALKN
jgi:hypothetical protein